MKISDSNNITLAYRQFSPSAGAKKTDTPKNTDRLEISRPEKSPADMTLDEYKTHIHQKLSAIKPHPSRSDDWISVNISDEGFQAMKNDPSYEKWVLDTVRSDMLSANPYSKYGSITDIKYFGASKEEYRCESYNSGFNRMQEKENEKKTAKSFWELRRKRQKLHDLLAEKHRLEIKELDEEVLAQKLMDEENIYCKKAKKFTFSAAKDILFNMDIL